jgi:hypothetical protein
MVKPMNPTQQRQNFRANSSKQTDADTLGEARDLVDQFLLYLKHADLGLDVIDIDDLPFRKPLLINAVRLMIATEPSETIRQQLRKVGLALASFQEDIGQRMSMRPVSSNSQLSDEDMQGLMMTHRDQILRFDRAFAAMASERLQLDDLFQFSMRMAERRASNAAATAQRRTADTSAAAYSSHF